MTDMDRQSGADDTSDEVTVETTSVFRADFLSDLDAPASPAGETSVSGVEGLPVGAALLVVKRGPNAGSRFLLDQPTTAAGRHPDSDIFLDDVTVSRRHAEFRLETTDLSGLAEAEREAQMARLAEEWSRRAFDLERGPLWRAWLVRLGAEEHALVVVVHQL